MPYAELHAKTNFSFQEGASHPDELVQRAAELGYTALADPEAYRDLLVRVSGFSAYFTQLDRKVQHDIMRRRAHRPA